MWKDATCEAPTTCFACGETAGNALGHRWEGATCVEAKKCAICQATEGKALGHDWKEATYANPKTCSTCGKTEGSALPSSSNSSSNNDTKKCLYCDDEVWNDKLFCKTHGCSFCDFNPAKHEGNTWGAYCVQHSCSYPNCFNPASTNGTTCPGHTD